MVVMTPLPQSQISHAPEQVWHLLGERVQGVITLKTTPYSRRMTDRRRTKNHEDYKRRGVGGWVTKRMMPCLLKVDYNVVRPRRLMHHVSALLYLCPAGPAALP